MSRLGDLFQEEIRVVNVGLESFAHELERLQIPVVHVAWSPPAGGDLQKARLLAALADEDEEEVP